MSVVLTTRAERMQLLEEWQRMMLAATAQWDALVKITRAAPDSPLGDAFWRMAGRFTDLVSDRLGDEGEWLQWWWLECDLGETPRGVCMGAERIVRTLDDLMDVIEWVGE